MFFWGHGVHATNRAAIIIRDVHLLKRVIFSLLSYTDDICVCILHAVSSISSRIKSIYY